MTIRESGNATVVIDMEGISWHPDTEGREHSIKEKIRADLGRVPYGWKLLCDEENRDSSRLEFWTHPQSDDFDKHRPISVEYLEMVTEPTGRPLSRDAESFYRLRHLLFNGYALDEEDFKEMHANGARALRQEVCTIQSDHPTELLELVVKFPSEELFPKRSEFHIEPWRKDSLPNETSLAILNRIWHTPFVGTCLLA